MGSSVTHTLICVDVLDYLSNILDVIGQCYHRELLQSLVQMTVTAFKGPYY